MDGLLRLSKGIDWINEKIGKNAAWLLLAAVIISAVNAIIRKVFNSSSNAWLEAQWLLFGAVFLLCAPWTLMHNEHIRIDIVNSRLSQRWKRGIEFLGHGLFLIPVCLVMIVTAYPFFMSSWRVNEQSSNAGGLPQYPAKFLVLAGFVLLLAQGISEFIKRVAVSKGLMEDTLHGGGHHAAAEAEAQRLLEVAQYEAKVREQAARDAAKS